MPGDRPSASRSRRWQRYHILAPFAALVLLLNLTRADKVAGLAAPRPAPGAVPRRPVDAGKPLYARPKAVIGFLVPIVLLVTFIVVAVATGPAGAPYGSTSP